MSKVCPFELLLMILFPTLIKKFMVFNVSNFYLQVSNLSPEDTSSSNVKLLLKLSIPLGFSCKLISLPSTTIPYKHTCTMPGTQNATMIIMTTYTRFYFWNKNLQLWLVNVTFWNTIQWPDKMKYQTTKNINTYVKLKKSCCQPTSNLLWWCLYYT